MVPPVRPTVAFTEDEALVTLACLVEGLAKFVREADALTAADQESAAQAYTAAKKVQAGLGMPDEVFDRLFQTVTGNSPRQLLRQIGASEALWAR